MSYLRLSSAEYDHRERLSLHGFASASIGMARLAIFSIPVFEGIVSMRLLHSGGHGLADCATFRPVSATQIP